MKLRSHDRPANQGGFTLIEVMLTLVIMAGILITISQILTAARRSRDTIHNMQERQLAGPAILDMIERDLRGILTFNRFSTDVILIRDRILAGLDADSLDFTTSTDSLILFRQHEGDVFRRADFNEVGYRLRRNPNSDDFLEIYRREDFGIDDEPFRGGAYSLLHDRIKGFDIQVYDEDGIDAEPLEAWGGDSEGTEGLPTRIEILLTIELAPRISTEQLVRDTRSVEYKRVIRFPELVRRTIQDPDAQPIAAIPEVAPPVIEATPGSDGSGDPDGAGGEGGGGGGGGRGEGTLPGSDSFESGGLGGGV